MKKVMQFLPATAFAIVALIGCKENKTTETTVTTDSVTTPITDVAKGADNTNTVAVDASQVPDTVRTSFERKYVNASKVNWMEYEPTDYDDLQMDQKYYYVTYYSDGADYTSWYDNRGEWVKTSTRIEGDPNLPDAVNKTINAQYEGYTIVEIDKENDKNRELYEIELKNGEKKAKLKILPNGQIVKRKD